LAEAPDKPFRVLGSVEHVVLVGYRYGPDIYGHLLKTDPETGEAHAYYTNEDGRFEELGVVAHVGMGSPGYIAVEAKGQFPIEVAFADPGSRLERDCSCTADVSRSFAA
jgi:hypothetical protein